MAAVTGRSCLALIVASLPALPAKAQVPGLPGPAQPGFQRREFQPAPVPRATSRQAAPAAPATPVAPSGTAFILRGIRLEGAVVLPAEATEPLWREMIGQPTTLADIAALADRLSALYRQRGYVLSQVIVPAQRVEDGIVRLRAVEGFIGALNVEGGTPATRAAAERLLAPAIAARPLSLAQLERGLLLSRDILGGGVDSVLRPSAETFGAADLGVRITPRPVEGFAQVDSRGSRLLGPLTARGGLSLFGLGGLNERLDLQLAGTPGSPELRYGQAVLSLPLLGFGPALDGALVQVAADHTRGNPDLARSGAEGITSTVRETQLRASLIVPIIRTRPENLFARASLIWRDSTSRSRFEGEDLGEATDRLLILEGRLTWDIADSLDGVTLVDAGLRRGLATAGTSIGTTGPGAPAADFLLLGGTLARVQRLGDSWSVLIEGSGQWARDPLPSSERFGLGGERLGRGYAPGNTTGDSGFAGRGELRRAFSPGVGGGFAETAEAYVFGDWGAAIDRSIARDGRRWESLASAGAGLRIDLLSWLTFNPEVAVQLAGRPSDTSSAARGTRFLFALTARY